MKNILNLVLFVLGVSAAVLVERDYALAQNDLTKDNNDITALDNSIKAYDGSFNAGLNMQSACMTLDKDLQTTCTDFKNMGTLTSSQATSITNYLTNTIEPNLKKAISDLVTKSATYSASGVCDSIKQFRTDFQCICSSGKGNFPSASQSGFSSVCSKIDTDFANGLKSLKC